MALGVLVLLGDREQTDWAMYPSKPMREIALVADAMEEHLRFHMPITFEFFELMGRVAP